MLAIRGRIFPSTAQNVTLEAELEDGTIVAGETKISRSRKRIAAYDLVPRRVRPFRKCCEALREADLILVGPGSLYTSIIPNLLVERVVETIVHSRATRVYIANLMTQPGETQHYSVADHVRAIYDHTRTGLFDFVVINRRNPESLLKRYRARALSRSELRRGTETYGPAHVTGDFFARSRGPPRSGASDASLAREICEAPVRKAWTHLKAIRMCNEVAPKRHFLSASDGEFQ